MATDEVDRAYQQVSRWIDDVLQNLQLIRWKPIGFLNSHPSILNNSDNSAPSGEALYSIPNPNDAIDSLLSKYSNEVYHNLALLLKQHYQTKHVKSEGEGGDRGGGGGNTGKGRKRNNNSNNNNSNSNNSSHNSNNSRQLLNPPILAMSTASQLVDYPTSSSSTTSYYPPPPLPPPPSSSSNPMTAEELLFRGRANSLSNGSYTVSIPWSSLNELLV